MVQPMNPNNMAPPGPPQGMPPQSQAPAEWNTAPAAAGNGQWDAAAGRWIPNPVQAPPQAPPQGMPPQGPPQGMPPQAMGGPPQGMPPMGGPPQGMPPQAMGMPQGGPPQGMPPMGGPPQGMPPQAMQGQMAQALRRS